MELIQEAHIETFEEKVRKFSYIDEEKADGWMSFPCDWDGNPVGLTEEAEKNFEYCVSHPQVMKDEGVCVEKRISREPAVIRCDCGGKLKLFGMAKCRCGRTYNVFGQEIDC